MRRLFFALLCLATGWARAQDPIIGYEYWFDHADADNERTFMPQTSTGHLVLGNEAIPAGVLGLGAHRVHYRIKDAGGAWSSVLYRSFTIFEPGGAQITGGEYWFDQVHQNRVPFAITPGQSINVTIAPDASGLAVGQHRIHYRLRDDRGQWSSVLYRSFSVFGTGPYNLVLMRYWSDPAYQNPTDMTEVAISPAVPYWQTADDILFCQWSTTGNTSVYFQLKDDHSQWSSILKKSINVDLVSAGPAAPGTITGSDVVLQNTLYQYGVAAVPGAGGYDWILPAGWAGSSTGTTIDVQTGTGSMPDSIGVAAYNGCGTSDTTWFYFEVSGNGGLLASATENLRLFPNPSNGWVVLVNEGGAAIDRLVVLNAMGQVVRDERPEAADRFTLDLSGAANGLYTVRITQAGKTSTLPVVVQH